MLTGFLLCANFSYLQVKWDEYPTMRRSERVSLWEIEPFVGSVLLNCASPIRENKRPKTVENTSSGM